MRKNTNTSGISRRAVAGTAGKRASSRSRGIALITTAIIIVVMILFVGLTLDVVKVSLAAHQLQNAADAAALAGAQLVKYNQQGATAKAIEIAGENYAVKLPVAVAENATNDPNGEVVIGTWVRQERLFNPTTIIGLANAVKVRANRPGLMGAGFAPSVPLLFGPVVPLLFGATVGVNTAAISRYATAVSFGSSGSGIITLARDPKTLPGWNKDTGLLMDGGTIVDLRGVDPVTGEPMMGDIQVNAESTSSPWAGFRLNGSSADIYAGEFNVVGDTNPDADDADKWESVYADPTIPFSVNPSSPEMPDPLADLIPPDISTMPIGTDTNGVSYSNPADTITGGNLTLNPGYYPGGINMSGGSIVLNPGVYAFGGGTDGGSGLVFTGPTSLIGNGVMLYVTIGIPGNTATYGQISMQGNGTLQLTSRGDAMDPAVIDGEMGIVIWQDRDNPSYGTINGTVASDDSFIKGVIYCGYNAMKITGTPNQTGSQLIVGALEIGGNISLGIAYDGRNSKEVMQSYLVE